MLFNAIVLAASLSLGAADGPGQVSAKPPLLYREVFLTAMGGPYRGPADAAGAGMSEVGAAWGWEHFAAGFRLSMETIGAGAGFGLGATLGPRFPLSGRLGIELTGDLGATLYSRDGESSIVIASESNSGSTAFLPTAGLRAGLTLLGPKGELGVTLGAMVRWVQPEQVEYSSTHCALVFCATRDETAGYGGTTVGAYLTVVGVRRYRPAPR